MIFTEQVSVWPIRRVSLVQEAAGEKALGRDGVQVAVWLWPQVFSASMRSVRVTHISEAVLLYASALTCRSQVSSMGMPNIQYVLNKR